MTEAPIRPHRGQSFLRGALFMVISAACFAAAHTGVRKLAGDIHPFETVLARNVFGLLLLSPFLLRNHMRALYTKRIKLHGLRGLLNGIFTLAFFFSLSLIPVAEATALNFTAPLFGAFLAALILHEKVSWQLWLTLLAGFAGTMVILRPGIAAINLGALLVLFASLSWGGVMVTVKSLSSTESSLTITGYLTIFLLPFSIVSAIPFWEWPSLEQTAWMFGIAAVATVAQLALAESLKWANASAVAPIDFSRLIFAAAFGFLLFGEVPEIWLWIGGGIIFTSAISVMRLESRRNTATAEKR